MKFTEPGGGIRLSARMVGDEVALAVADTGVGVPSAKLEAIFDRFAQVDDSATRRHEGTGIGLALAKDMVELHGGRIRAASAGEGCGTTIHLTLPVGEPDALLEEEALCDEQGQVHRLGASLAALAEGAPLESEPDVQGSSRSRPLPEMNHTVGRWADRTGAS